jgi:RNA polymerase sigma factor (TIGR02999 family)
MTPLDDKAVHSKPITQWLIAWRNGDQDALDKLIPLVYEELHQLASRQMSREKGAHILQTTALVNEAYCKLVEQKEVQWQNRAHFFAIAAQLMRRILVDEARRKFAAKRGGDPLTISLNEHAILHQQRSADLVSLDDALVRLAEFDSRKCRIVEMKFFGGLTNEEIAGVENVSLRTINREWRKARAWLIDALLR